MTLTPGTGRPTLGDSLNRGIFLRLDTDPVIRLWSGTRRIRVEANDADLAAADYDGLPVIRDVPEIDRLINGEARRVTFKLNGLTRNIADLIDAEASAVEGVRARLGHLRYDRRWRPTGTLRWMFDGTLDEIGLEWEQAGAGHLWTATISISSAMVERNRPLLLFWTPIAQAVISPTDRGLEYVPNYNAGTTRPYPPR